MLFDFIADFENIFFTIRIKQIKPHMYNWILQPLEGLQPWLAFLTFLSNELFSRWDKKFAISAFGVFVLFDHIARQIS